MEPAAVRKAFLDFFQSKGHTHVKSSPLVPEGDATLLFANAGMNQFKEQFTGQSKRDYSKATSSQKCVRAGGKHNDLENVGKTARHHTFFEMLGNFSFGDYFKREAIQYAWEFLTEVLQLNQSKLWITIHDSDDEAGKLWLDIAGLAPERIVKMGDKDNFWAMGETGPCGPCSEIHYDQGAEVGCGQSDCNLECDCDRYLEIWNLVFMQYEQKADGTRVSLPNPCIDTGMGLERLCAVIEQKKSNYDTDLFMPLIRLVSSITRQAYDEGEGGVSHRILADHAKAATFLIFDGIYPSNEGRGYVLRRIMRRAIRHSYLLGMRVPILHELVEKAINMYNSFYPELNEKAKHILDRVKEEERSFLKTIEKGIQLFDQQKESWKKSKRIPGDAAFKLYDTFGFPLDLTQVMAEQEGLNVDEKGFDLCMEEQRKKAQASSMFKTGKLEGLHWKLLNEGEQVFSGYSNTELKTKVLKVSETSDGQCVIIPKDCVFYGESGGQVGDTGSIDLKGERIQVEDTQIVDGSRVLLLQKGIDSNTITSEDEVVQFVDVEQRQMTKANHTSTHLLHKVLKEVIGEHAEQRGSWVGPTHLRFDFPHNKALSKEELKKIESEVNLIIQQNISVSSYQKSLDEAKKEGVTALFGEKYGDTVRVVDIDHCSKELCGGTHLERTGEALAFVLKSEASIASGVRRIEALTGKAALNTLFKDQVQLKEVSSTLQSRPDELNAKVSQLLEENQQLRKKNSHLRQEMVMGELEERLKSPSKLGSISYLAEVLSDMDAGDLRKAAESIKNRMPDLPFILASTLEGKVSLVLGIPKTWVKDLSMNAGKLLKPLAAHIKGGGGGSPELAQAGGKDEKGLTKVLEGFKVLISEVKV